MNNLCLKAKQWGLNKNKSWFGLLFHIAQSLSVQRPHRCIQLFCLHKMFLGYLGIISSLGTRFWNGEMFRKMADKMTARPNLASIGKESISRERLFLAENCIEAKLFRIPFYAI